jgi:hypothetical protein
MRSHRLIITSIALLALTIAGTGCDALRDSEPFTITVTYVQGPDGTITLEPAEIIADNSWGQVQVDNQTDARRGFAIDDLAVYEEIPARDVRTIQVDEAKDGRTYAFYDHKNPGEVEGEIKVRYRAEEFR